MITKLLKLPYVGLVMKVVTFCVVAVLVVVSVISYCGYVSLEMSLEELRRTNADNRTELASMESRLEQARKDVERGLEKERALRDRTQELRKEALQLERDWEEVKGYKRRIEESGREIEELRRRISKLGG